MKVAYNKNNFPNAVIYSYSFIYLKKYLPSVLFMNHATHLENRDMDRLLACRVAILSISYRFMFQVD